MLKYKKGLRGFGCFIEKGGVVNEKE